MFRNKRSFPNIIYERSKKKSPLLYSLSYTGYQESQLREIQLGQEFQVSVGPKNLFKHGNGLVFGHLGLRIQNIPSRSIKNSSSKKDVCEITPLPMNKNKNPTQKGIRRMTDITDNKNEETEKFLRYEIADLKSALRKRDDQIVTLNNMLKQIMDAHHAEVRAYEDLEDKLEDVVEMLRKRAPHGDILDYLKAEDSNEYQFRKLW